MTGFPPRRCALLAAPLLLAALWPGLAWPAAPVPGTPLTIERARGPIAIDGDLSDPGWQGLQPITTWFETNPGDNTEPQVKNVAYLTFDDHYLYAAFQLDDPHPEAIRAPLGDHDAVPSSTDYAGVIVDSRNDGKTAQMFLANPRGVQYDAMTSDATGEDSSPDFYWDSAGRITATGWSLEIRIPFSSLRYASAEQPTWGILLYRNYPRDRRYQYFSARLPRDVNCFICNATKLVGLSRLPRGSHLVVAPFATTQQSSAPRAGLGTPLAAGDVKSASGLDLKWSPASSAAIDATLKPDFSQVESDVAQIVANERFALFFPEKRPFFLEGVDMLSTPLQAVYTRTVTSPLDGLRATGKLGSTAYTALVTRDRGGGLVILPGPEGSGFAPQDFTSDVEVARVRRDLGRSFVSLLATGREIESGGHNVVMGPDFQWRPRPGDAITGQGLWSETRTPMRPDLASEWDGRRLSDRALLLSWSHGTPHEDWFLQGQDLGRDFRADDGFIPQVGYREAYLDGGYTIHPSARAFFSRARFFTTDYLDLEPGGGTLGQRLSVGTGADGRWNSFLRVELNEDDVRVGGAWLSRFRPRVVVQSSPGRLLNQLSLDTYFGQEVDFDNARTGRGATFVGTVTVRPGNHLELRGDGSARWLDIGVNGGWGRLFTAQVERLRATWAFDSRSFARLIGQYVQTQRDPSLYTFAVSPKDADFTASALVAYKLNWQTVVYAGYGDDREFLQTVARLENNGHQLFAKLSYAWQQ